MNAHAYNFLCARWSSEMDDKLKALIVDGASFSEAAVEINKAFGVTLSRNSCIGRAHRLGIKGKRPRRRRQGVNVTKRPRLEARAHKQKEPKFVFRPIIKPTFDFRKLNTISLAPKNIGHDGVDLPPATPGPNAVSLLDASHCHCRWPYGDPRDLGTFRFCGEIAVGQPYCPGHQRQSEDKRPVKKRRPYKD